MTFPEDPQGNLPADAILALLEQAGDYEVDAFQAKHRGCPPRCMFCASKLKASVCYSSNLQLEPWTSLMLILGLMMDCSRFA